MSTARRRATYDDLLTLSQDVRAEVIAGKLSRSRHHFRGTPKSGEGGIRTLGMVVLPQPCGSGSITFFLENAADL